MGKHTLRTSSGEAKAYLSPKLVTHIMKGISGTLRPCKNKPNVKVFEITDDWKMSAGPLAEIPLWKGDTINVTPE